MLRMQMIVADLSFIHIPTALYLFSQIFNFMPSGALQN